MAKDKGKKEKKKPKKAKINLEGFAPLEALLIAVIIGIVGFAGWYVYHSNNNANNIYDNAARVNTVAKSAAKKSTVKTTPVASPAPSPISAALKENAAAAIDSKNTAALAGFMASSVNVVVAGSGHNVTDTPAQAVTELDYFKDSVSPWNFSLDTATLTSYKNGSYGTYFGTNTIVGKSTDNMVVSFGVNNAGKIDKIFMAAQASLLTE